MPLTPGDKLGPYEILAFIGKGGMGEVWKARDPRVGRDVAIKASVAQFSERFEREVKAIGALNHPNICTLYDVGPSYLVMEFVDGAPIAPTDDVTTLLDKAKQMAEGLTAAHARGITHRDLKPGNILLTRDGRVKILDFGLATSAPSTSDATLTMLTDPGTTLGTVAYMSPEQARGQAVDARSDLWSLGVILYEMATGTRPFDGPSAPVIFEAILNRAPAPVRERNPKIPVELERIIARLLEKDRETRYQSAADVRADLKRVERDSSATGVATPLKSHHRRKYAIAAATLFVLIAGGFFLWQRTRPKPLTDQDVLVLADFANNTGDPKFDGALRPALTLDLEESPFLKVMDEQEVNETLKLMGRAPGERITNDIAQEVCVRKGQKATIRGSIANLGKTYAIALEAINCQTGATVAREGTEAEDEDHVIKAVAKATTALRAQLGESLSSIQKTELSRPDVATNSLEALKAFGRGFDLMSQSGSNREAIPQFQRAIELDPDFAVAYAFLSLAYRNTGQAALQAKSLSKAFELKDRLSESARLEVSGVYYETVAHDLNKAMDAYRMLVSSFPSNPDGYLELGRAYWQKGEYEKALEQHQQSGRLAPLSLPFQYDLAVDYVNLDRFDEAKAVAERAFAQKLDGPDIHQLLLRIAYIQDDQAAQAKEFQWWAGKPEEYQSLGLQSTNALMHGQRGKAKEFDQGRVEMARREGVAAVQPANPALIDAQVGDCEAARKAKLTVVPPPCMDASALRLVVEEAAKNPPQNPDNLRLLYQRGLAALNAGKGAEAAAEFQKILDHKGRNWGPLYSTAYLGMARGEAMAGDTAKAKRAYQDFLALWKDADKDAPFFLQATKGLAALR